MSTSNIEEVIYEITDPMPREICAIICSYIQLLPTRAVLTLHEKPSHVCISNDATINVMRDGELKRYSRQIDGSYSAKNYISTECPLFNYRPQKCGTKFVSATARELIIMDDKMQIVNTIKHKKDWNALTDLIILGKTTFVFDGVVYNTDLKILDESRRHKNDQIIAFDDAHYVRRTETCLTIYDEDNDHDYNRLMFYVDGNLCRIEKNVEYEKQMAKYKQFLVLVEAPEYNDGTIRTYDPYQNFKLIDEKKQDEKLVYAIIGDYLYTLYIYPTKKYNIKMGLDERYVISGSNYIADIETDEYYYIDEPENKERIRGKEYTKLENNWLFSETEPYLESDEASYSFYAPTYSNIS